MNSIARRLVAIAAVVAGLRLGPPLPATARGENLGQAWSIALGVNQRLQSQQAESVAAGYTLAAARSARLPTVRTFNFESFLTTTPSIRNTLLTSGSAAGTTGTTSGVAGTTATLGAGAGGAGAAASSSAAAGGLAGLPATIPLLGQGQRQLPVSVTFATVPLYSGGRIRGTIDAAGSQVTAQRTEEFRTALDLKLTVAEAYVGVLRGRKNLQVAESDVQRLASFARDTRNRGDQGLAIKSDVLAAEVSLANARLSEIQARTNLANAWATYNRYLCRPLTAVVPLDELTDFSIRVDPSALNTRLPDDAEVITLTQQAIQRRPELAGLSAQARALGFQADANLGNIKPQVAFTMSFLYLGNNLSVPQGIGAATFIADWTITDGGATRRRSASLRQQEFAALKRRRADTCADIALEVRTRWLDLQQARLRVPVARLAVAQAEENINVLLDRYRQQLSTYTEVLDAENRRVQSLTNFFNAVYDESLALFRLRRAVGDL